MERQTADSNRLGLCCGLCLFLSLFEGTALLPVFQCPPPVAHPLPPPTLPPLADPILIHTTDDITAVVKKIAYNSAVLARWMD